LEESGKNHTEACKPQNNSNFVGEKLQKHTRNKTKKLATKRILRTKEMKE